MIQGQDWSSYQANEPSTKGLDFVIVKATEGAGYVNPRMKAQAKHARAAGLVLGFYHFLRPGNMKAQAEYFVDRADSVEGDILVADWEDSAVSNSDKDAFIKEVIRLRGKNHRVGLYTYTNFWKTKDTTSYCGDFLWIAHYGVGAGRPGIEHKWLIHQYSDNPVDKNVARFASRAAMRAWADKEPASPAPTPKPAEPKPAPKPVVSQAAKVLAIAAKEVGTKERRSGGHWVNDSKYNRWFGRIPSYGQDGYGWPWCAAFVSWVGHEAGAKDLYPKTASCSAGVAWFRGKGRFSEYPAVGAQVFFGAGGGSHTGIVYKYDANYIWTYEGNTNASGSAEGDGVYAKKRERRAANTYGYGYPKFAEGIVTADPSLKGRAGYHYKATASAPVTSAPAPKPEPRKLEWQAVSGYMPELHYGDENWHVDWLQRNLNRFLSPNIKVDGKYGDATARAVHQFYKEQLDYTTTTNGRVFSAGGWRRVLSTAATNDGES